MIYQINNILVETNFIIGKIIVKNEQNGNIPAEYEKDILKEPYVFEFLEQHIN